MTRRPCFRPGCHHPARWACSDGTIKRVAEGRQTHNFTTMACDLDLAQAAGLIGKKSAVVLLVRASSLVEVGEGLRCP